MAILLENSLRDWLAAHQPLLVSLTERATDRYIAVLGDPTQSPSPEQMARAAAAAQDEVYLGLTADAVLDSLPRPPATAGAQEALRGSWRCLSPAWQLPPPPVSLGLPAQRLAVAAGVGSLLGMILLGGVLHLALDLRPLGMTLVAVGGAAAAIYLVVKLADSRTLRVTLTTLMGAAFTADLLVKASTLGLGALWGRLGAMGLLRRSLVYFAVVAVLALTRGQGHYDTRAYRRVIGAMIRPLVDYSSLLLGTLSAEQAALPASPPSGGSLDAGLARAFLELHHSDAPGLPTAAESLLLEARRLGLDGVGTPPRFLRPEPAAARPRLIWKAEMGEQYQTFGLIEEGDTVIVEDEPVYVNGHLVEKGRVRKIRV